VFVLTVSLGILSLIHWGGTFAPSRQTTQNRDLMCCIFLCRDNPAPVSLRFSAPTTPLCLPASRTVTLAPPRRYSFFLISVFYSLSDPGRGFSASFAALPPPGSAYTSDPGAGRNYPSYLGFLRFRSHPFFPRAAPSERSPTAAHALGSSFMEDAHIQ